MAETPAGIEALTFRPIGVIRTPHTAPAGAPIQPQFAASAVGRVELDPAFAEGLASLEEFDRVWLIYAFDRVGAMRLTVRPFMDDADHGVFSTRAPCRPNAIGLSPVKLLGIEGSVLHVGEVDMLDGTPLLDIKPYSPKFDCFPDANSGWLDRVAPKTTQADDRFS